MAMGFGCNAAGIIATRVIDSPRERLVAILTNNFVPCNGRFPTLIMLATVFVAAAFPPAIASLVAAGSVVAIVLLGVLFTLVVSWVLTRTILKGEASAFTLELPPYRRPGILRIALHLADRPDAVRPVAGDVDGGAGRRGDLAARQHCGRRREPGDPHRRGAAAARLGDGPGRRDPARLHHRHPRQRDRRPDDADGLHGAGHDDRPAVVRSAAHAARRSARLDDADGREPDAVFPAAQSRARPR